MFKILQQYDKGTLCVAIAAIILLIPLGYSIVTPIFAHDDPITEVFLEKPDPSHTNCVRDTRYMRLHHWELLTNIREEVVRFGNRTIEIRDGKKESIGLNDCRNCHTSRARFCDRCHNAVNLYPECWGCHYYP